MGGGRVFLSLLVAVAALAQFASPGANKTGGVEGKVVNSMTGDPVSHAAIKLQAFVGEKSFSAESDRDGRFRFSDVEPGLYLAIASADGYSPPLRVAASQQPVTVMQEQVTQDVDLKLRPLSTISGRVVDDDGNAIAGIVVRAIRATYAISVPGGLPVYVKSMSYGRQDVSGGVIRAVAAGIALDIVLGSDPGTADIVVEQGVRKGVPVMVVGMPADPYAARDDLLRAVAANTGDRVALPYLAPGDYRVFALETASAEDARDRELLHLLKRESHAFTVHPNGHETVIVTSITATQIENARQGRQ